MTTINSYISTPGEILKEEFLEPLGISQYRFAKAIGKSQSAISEIVKSQRAITPEMAILFAKALGTTPDFWLRLEASYQLKTCNMNDPRFEKVPLLVNIKDGFVA